MHLFKYLEMPPRFFGPRLREIIKIRLRQEVTGTCGRQGFIIAVQEIEEIGEGLLSLGRHSPDSSYAPHCKTQGE